MLDVQQITTLNESSAHHTQQCLALFLTTTVGLCPPAQYYEQMFFAVSMRQLQNRLRFIMSGRQLMGCVSSVWKCNKQTCNVIVHMWMVWNFESWERSIIVLYHCKKYVEMVVWSHKVGQNEQQKNQRWMNRIQHDFTENELSDEEVLDRVAWKRIIRHTDPTQKWKRCWWFAIAPELLVCEPH